MFLTVRRPHCAVLFMPSTLQIYRKTLLGQQGLIILKKHYFTISKQIISPRFKPTNERQFSESPGINITRPTNHETYPYSSQSLTDHSRLADHSRPSVIKGARCDILLDCSFLSSFLSGPLGEGGQGKSPTYPVKGRRGGRSPINLTGVCVGGGVEQVPTYRAGEGDVSLRVRAG